MHEQAHELEEWDDQKVFANAARLAVPGIALTTLIGALSFGLGATAPQSDSNSHSKKREDR